eukprot:CAMPEP_0176328596 /NCGR_PEP_ID=MMETSP0121_2-20121125/75041_1 /TAXON_ID=160619 /ORGANISM="Kryptoperidinium foliaceum, Strain CCMP 1326" /LENGTH=143 /DNA_ID=CAMNT_0017671265 /DNA_START=102 /DNA_END=530 /DNA_ORIENTATION=-
MAASRIVVVWMKRAGPPPNASHKLPRSRRGHRRIRIVWTKFRTVLCAWLAACATRQGFCGRTVAREASEAKLAGSMAVREGASSRTTMAVRCRWRPPPPARQGSPGALARRGPARVGGDEDGGAVIRQLQPALGLAAATGQLV